MIERALELYARRGWTPFEFQRAAWSAYLAGEDVLVHAPTGLGKTEAAFLGPVLRELEAPDGSNGPRVIWITPLREQARREVLDHQFEIARLAAALERMAASTWHVVVATRMTPFSFPLWAESIRGEVTSEAWEDRVRRMAIAVERSA